MFRVAASKAAFTLALRRRVGLDVKKDEKHKRGIVQLIRPPTHTHTSSSDLGNDAKELANATSKTDGAFTTTK